MKRKITAPKWRKVAPADLRFKEKIVYGGIFSSTQTSTELQQKWERIHAGVVIDTEWRPIPTHTNYRFPWEY